MNHVCQMERSQIQPNVVYINFLAVSMKIAMLQPVRKFSEKRLFSLNPIKIPLLGYFCMQNSFLHCKRSQSLRFLRNMQKIEKNICYHYFLFFVIFSFSFKQNFLKPNESCLLDERSQIQLKVVYINFLAVSMKIAMLQLVRKFSEKRLFSLNPIKIPLLGYFFMQNSFLHCKRSQSLRFLRNMQKIEKKYLLSLFSIFCDFLFQFQAKFPKIK